MMAASFLFPEGWGDEGGGGREAGEELADGFDGGEALSGEGVLAAIVEDEVGAAVTALVASDAAFDAGEDFRGGDGLPVADNEVPLNGLQAELTAMRRTAGRRAPCGGRKRVTGWPRVSSRRGCRLRARPGWWTRGVGESWGDAWCGCR